MITYCQSKILAKLLEVQLGRHGGRAYTHAFDYVFTVTVTSSSLDLEHVLFFLVVYVKFAIKIFK